MSWLTQTDIGTTRHDTVFVVNQKYKISHDLSSLKAYHSEVFLQETEYSMGRLARIFGIYNSGVQNIIRRIDEFSSPLPRMSWQAPFKVNKTMDAHLRVLIDRTLLMDLDDLKLLRQTLSKKVGKVESEI
ncbi:hypothetical protein K501DRAFT_268365 [Backusella circina FSU 941]|nr:hypothetical protein K501DRAFT_268365 [Backusella circina FSU 941]